jgi:HlyD family secretion protein
MDVKRDPAILRKKKIRQAILAGIGVVAVVAISVAVSRLKPAAPSVPGETLWFDTVKRGDIMREVRGAGTLVPEEIRWIPATTSGRVEQIVLRPGAQVKVGTLILILSNPDLQQQVKAAELDWKSAQAQLANQRATLNTTRMQQTMAVSNAESDLKVAKSDLDANEQLGKQGLVADLTVKQKQATVDRAKNALELAQKQLASAIENEQSQIAPAEAVVNQRRATYDQLQRQMSDLEVKSPMSGQLQLVSVERGQQVGPGTNLVRVSDPTKLKAEIRISETQTPDLRIGQPADVDTRNGHVKGVVSRIDPSSVGGTVGVDVTLDGPLPAGARPDLSVDGTIQLENLQNVLYVQSPAFGQENASIGLFKMSKDATEAGRTTVKLGKRSVQFVEIREGLVEGDTVILSDMSQYDAYDRIRCAGSNCRASR